MLASKVKLSTLEAAAEQIGVNADITTLNTAQTRHRVKLYPIVPASAWQVDESRTRLCPICGVKTRIKSESASGLLVGECSDAAPPARWAGYRRWKDERGDSPYQRISAAVMFREGRRVHAVCWHGFRDFFRAVFKKEPEATFHTALATWKGSKHFEANYRESGHRNIGSQMAPVYAAEACRCGEEGMAV